MRRGYISEFAMGFWIGVTLTIAGLGMLIMPAVFDAGVRAHADGKQVVATLPDGTRKVYAADKIKQPPALEAR